MKLFDRSTKAGFTLVELIVVIAILAILAGIAIPVYSGYIKKAHEAADNMLLDAVNAAFAAASYEGGQYDGRPATASAKIDGDGKLPAGSVTSSVDENGEAFDRYFAGNENSKFESIKKLAYDRNDGVFYGLTGGETSEDLGGGWTATTYTGKNGTVTTYANSETGMSVDVSSKDKDAVDNSTFGDKNVMTMEGMMNEIQGVVDLANGMLGGSGGAASALTAMSNDPAFQSYLKSLGVTEADLAEDNTKMMNALVLYAASNTDSVNTTAVLTQLKAAGNTPANVLAAAGAGGTDTASQLSSAAMIYGLATAYAHKNNIESGNAIGTLVAAINDPGWSNYLDSEQAQKDIAGYSGAMGMISDNIVNLGTDSLLSDGFASEGIIDMLNLVFDQGGEG